MTSFSIGEIVYLRDNSNGHMTKYVVTIVGDKLEFIKKDEE
jgi:hypothetical protein